VGFEPTIPASERTKTVHALERAATVTDIRMCMAYMYLYQIFKGLSLHNNADSYSKWARGSVIGLASMLQAGKSRVRVPMRWIFFNLPNPSNRIMDLRSTQPLTEMSTRNLPGGKGRLARKADNLTAICESNV
jgi:hypothetical protein